MQTDSGQNPGDHRVGVPHLACTKLVTPPHRRGNGRHHGERLLHQVGFTREMDWTTDRAGKVGNQAAVPSPDFVAEEPETTGRSPPNGSFGDDSSADASASIGNGGHFDHGRRAVNDRDEGGVIQVLWGAVLHQCGQTLVRPAARAYDVATCTQRNPVQVKRRGSVAGGGMSPLHVCPRRTCHNDDSDDSFRIRLGTLFWASRDLPPHLLASQATFSPRDHDVPDWCTRGDVSAGRCRPSDRPRRPDEEQAPK